MTIFHFSFIFSFFMNHDYPPKSKKEALKFVNKFITTILLFNPKSQTCKISRQIKVW